jgi:BirA family biotin operon repressor/biotin-[acetyl-CoA-carboxylase] ligase
MEEKIVAFLKEAEGRYVSGEEFSKILGVTRASVWKHIEELRALGYEIEAQPHLGYRLVRAPDKLLPHEITSGLKTRFVGKKVYSYESTDSTNNRAYELAESGAKEGVTITAEQQKKGKGRLGRTWASPRGGIYFSVILRPQVTPTEVSKLTLVMAVSVAETVREMTGARAMIKWPNDILIDGRKICGILTELKAEQDMTSFVVVGIGINVNTKQASLPPGATSIAKETGREWSRIDLARALLKNIESHYLAFRKGGFGEIVEEWKKLSSVLGRRIKIAERTKIIEGTALDIDAGGALVVRLDNGFQERVLAGDIIVLR